MPPATSAEATTTSAAPTLGSLPAELIEIIFELAVDDGDLLDRKSCTPYLTVRILLASIHTSSRFRTINMAYKPLWRAVAAAIPRCLLLKTQFSRIFEFCSKQSNNTLTRVLLDTEGLRISMCVWQEIIKSIGFVSPSAPTLQAIGFPPQDHGNGWCACTFCRQSKAAGTTISRRDVMSAFLPLLKSASQNKSIDILGGHIEEIKDADVFLSPLQLAPQMMCLTIKIPNIYLAEYWNRLGRRLKNLCLLHSKPRSNYGLCPITLLLKASQDTLTCLELHTAKSYDAFRLPALPLLLKLRVQYSGNAQAASVLPDDTRCSFPSLRFADVPASVLHRISAPSLVVAAVTIDGRTYHSTIVESLETWPNLDSLAFHVDITSSEYEREEVGVVLDNVLAYLTPGAMQAKVICPALRQLVITNQLPRWHSPPHTMDSLANLTYTTWWKDVMTTGESKKGRPVLKSNPFEMTEVRQEVAKWSRRSPGGKRPTLKEEEKCRAVKSLSLIGCDVVVKY